METYRCIANKKGKNIQEGELEKLLQQRVTQRIRREGGGETTQETIRVPLG
jgi:hypothetical protein